MARLRLRLIALASVTGASLLLSTGWQSFKHELSNYGVKKRSLAGSIVSELASQNFFLRESAYRNIEDWVQYIKNSSEVYQIPSSTLAAILYEEQVHRKPVDFRTFGPAQIGIQELEIQGLPPDKKILEDPQLSILVLGRKLNRLRKQTGSLEAAITLHNGYSDFLPKVEERRRDPRLIMILTSKRTENTLFV